MNQLRIVIPGVAITILTAYSVFGGTMSDPASCTQSPVATSRCVIEAILADLSETYTKLGGGGIASITQEATWTYTVAISQEQRQDLVTYTVEMNDNDGTVRVVERKTGTKSYVPPQK